MIYSKIRPQTPDEEELLHDCDLPFAKSPHTAIVLDRTIQVDPKHPNKKPKTP